MTTEIILQKLKIIVEPYVQNKKAFKNYSEKTDFLKDLEINSANLVDIVLDIEDEFNITIDNDSMEKMTSVENSVEVIQRKISPS